MRPASTFTSGEALRPADRLQIVEPQIIVAHFLCAAPEDKNRKEVLMRVQIYVAAKRLAGAPRKLCLAVVTSQCMAPNQQPEPGPFTASPTS
jgi:hypothetical protein